jgi:hypothetical protein
MQIRVVERVLLLMLMQAVRRPPRLQEVAMTIDYPRLGGVGGNMVEVAAQFLVLVLSNYHHRD